MGTTDAIPSDIGYPGRLLRLTWERYRAYWTALKLVGHVASSFVVFLSSRIFWDASSPAETIVRTLIAVFSPLAATFLWCGAGSPLALDRILRQENNRLRSIIRDLETRLTDPDEIERKRLEGDRQRLEGDRQDHCNAALMKWPETIPVCDYLLRNGPCKVDQLDRKLHVQSMSNVRNLIDEGILVEERVPGEDSIWQINPSYQSALLAIRFGKLESND